VKKVEILYFDGCPTYKAAEKRVEGSGGGGHRRRGRAGHVNTDEGQAAPAPGSPTIRLDGQDLFPAPERENTGGWGAGSTRQPKA
jgi:hypothetical protein